MKREKVRISGTILGTVCGTILGTVFLDNFGVKDVEGGEDKEEVTKELLEKKGIWGTILGTI